MTKEDLIKAETFLRQHLPRVITGYHTLERPDEPEFDDTINKLNEDFREDFFNYLKDEKN